MIYEENKSVKCNNCEWTGKENDLIDESDNGEEACPKCGRKDAIMDIWCDNCDHDENKPREDVQEVKMKEEFEGGTALWCKECRERDNDFIA
jgi:Zn finger protein HypA/HybF involved in hydrogenase expression